MDNSSRTSTKRSPVTNMDDKDLGLLVHILESARMEFIRECDKLGVKYSWVPSGTFECTLGLPDGLRVRVSMLTTIVDRQTVIPEMGEQV